MFLLFLYLMYLLDCAKCYVCFTFHVLKCNQSYSGKCSSQDMRGPMWQIVSVSPQLIRCNFYAIYSVCKWDGRTRSLPAAAGRSSQISSCSAEITLNLQKTKTCSKDKTVALFAVAQKSPGHCGTRITWHSPFSERSSSSMRQGTQLKSVMFPHNKGERQLL